MASCVAVAVCCCYDSLLLTGSHACTAAALSFIIHRCKCAQPSICFVAAGEARSTALSVRSHCSCRRTQTPTPAVIDWPCMHSIMIVSFCWPQGIDGKNMQAWLARFVSQGTVCVSFVGYEWHRVRLSACIVSRPCPTLQVYISVQEKKF